MHTNVLLLYYTIITNTILTNYVEEAKILCWTVLNWSNNWISYKRPTTQNYLDFRS